MLGRDSPSFARTVKVTIQAAARGEEAGLTARALRQVSLCKELSDDRVERWLDRAIRLEGLSIYDDVKEPEVFDDFKKADDGRCSFNIWPEPGYTAADQREEEDQISTREALQDDVTDQPLPRIPFNDISNLQKPGYLGKYPVPMPIVWHV